jgi:hypothetical protein
VPVDRQRSLTMVRKLSRGLTTFQRPTSRSADSLVDAQRRICRGRVSSLDSTNVWLVKWYVLHWSTPESRPPNMAWCCREPGPQHWFGKHRKHQPASLLAGIVSHDAAQRVGAWDRFRPKSQMLTGRIEWRTRTLKSWLSVPEEKLVIHHTR